MRDARGRSPAPRLIGGAIGEFRESISPATPLAAVETVWREAVGDGIAAVARPVSEREGILTVECESAVWTQELALMEPKIRARLSALLETGAPVEVRFRTG